MESNGNNILAPLGRFCHFFATAAGPANVIATAICRHYPNPASARL
jgi:hypothetical protein